MSAYRNKPPPPHWRVVYRMPLRQRLGQSTLVAGALTAGSFAVSVVGLLLVDGIGLFLLLCGAMVFVTAAVLLGIARMTSASRLAERTIHTLEIDAGDPDRCRVLTTEERWRLPLPPAALLEGQTIRVRYREVSPDEDQETSREILEVRVAED